MFQYQVSIDEAVRRALTVNYCNFKGRSSRSEYWWFALFNIIVGVVLGIVLGIIGVSENVINGISSLLTLALFLPGLGLSVRRLHDIGKSGWWLFLALIPLVGAIILFIWYCKDSELEVNQYGPVPNLKGYDI